MKTKIQHEVCRMQERMLREKFTGLMYMLEKKKIKLIIYAFALGN